MILLKSRHGFTLMEIMIVIAIIGIIFGSMNYLSPGPRISRTKSERIATAVQDSIKSAQRDILTGRAPSSSIPVVKKIVTISVWPTPRITTNYITANSQTGVESTLNYPFYDGDKKFQLRDISLFATRPSAGIEQVGGSFVSFTWLTNISIAFNNDRTITLDSTDPAFVSAVNAWIITQSNIRYTMITTGYDAYEVKTRIDRVSGIVDALPMVQNTGTILTPPIYTWSTSDYSPCTLACGWWTQTRTTVCHDINDLTVADSFCDPALKPDLSLACNTQACPINGTCGSADSIPSSTIPNFWLCSSGSGSTPIINPAVPPATNDYWIWTCSGSNSGVTSNCSALKQTNYCVAGGVVSCIASGGIIPSCLIGSGIIWTCIIQ